MYVPPHFAETDVAALHETIRRFPLATLVVAGADGLNANHVPMLLQEGRLVCHVARANPLWRTVADGIPALAVFTGPDAYVSPAWYSTKAETGQVVPTWNYVAVHVRGTLRAFDDPAALRAHVGLLTATHEAGRPAPWAVEDAPDDYVAAMLRGIVGLTLTIERIDGKAKLSQNRNAADRAGVIAGLRATARPGAADVADAMLTRESS